MIAFLDIFGTFIFAISGAFRAVKHELDLLGVLVLSVATGVGGGIIRDLVVGSVPPAAFKDEKYLLVCFLGGLVVFIGARRIAQRWDWVMAADALGLGVFAAIGAVKAANHGFGNVGIIMMGAVTATGGGVIRDVVVREIPAALKADFYATATLIGGACLIAGRGFGISENYQLFSTIIVTSGLRTLSMKYRISLPQVNSLPASPTELTKQRKTNKVKHNRTQ